MKPAKPGTATTAAARTPAHSTPKPAAARPGEPTEAHELRERLLRAEAQMALVEQRLEAASWKATLASVTNGFAHDFNNKLAGTLSLSDLLLAQTAPEDPKRPSLELIKTSAQEMCEMVKRLVSLHRGQRGKRHYADLNQQVSGMAALARRILPRRIQIKTEPAPAQMPVYLDSAQFDRAVLNLVLNAADAMPERGELSLRVSAHSTAQRLQHSRGHFPRLPCVCLSIQDTGRGIPAAQLPQLFTRYFSTKPAGEGAGLGLSLAREFVEQHGGAISVESAEGAGATFHLWLPQADFTEAEQPPSS